MASTRNSSIGAKKKVISQRLNVRDFIKEEPITLGDGRSDYEMDGDNMVDVLLSSSSSEFLDSPEDNEENTPSTGHRPIMSRSYYPKSTSKPIPLRVAVLNRLFMTKLKSEYKKQRDGEGIIIKPVPKPRVLSRRRKRHIKRAKQKGFFKKKLRIK